MLSQEQFLSCRVTRQTMASKRKKGGTPGTMQSVKLPEGLPRGLFRCTRRSLDTVGVKSSSSHLDVQNRIVPCHLLRVSSNDW
jgi:hypothetical protein